MRKVLRKVLALGTSSLGLFLAGLMAQTAPSTQSFSATVFLDYRYFLSNSGPLTLKPSVDTTAYLNNQFVFRRAYFNYESKIGDNLKFRFRLDADNTANVTGVTLTGSPVTGVSLSKDDKLRPYIKHLFLECSDFLIPKMTLNVGMIETLAFKPAEERWGLRSVAKTLMDGYKDITKRDILATSADIGLSLKYSASKYFRLAAGVYNGAHYSHAENDQFKKIQVQAQVTPMAGFSVVGTYDYERKLPVASLPAESKPAAATYKLDVFFERIRNLVLGAELFTFKSDLNQTAGRKYNLGGWSVFGRYALNADKVSVFARYDSYRPNSLDRGLDMSLVIAGFDWAPYNAIWRLQPNIWFSNYKNGARYNSDAAKNTDVVFNLTFFLSF